MGEGDVALACASVFVDELVRGGVRDVAVCPGSRSTPVALAFARHGGVRVHVQLDERAAGFFALGLARAGARPVAVVTTSGTAAANLFPAVVEASMDGVPLLALTADRPPELRHVGANQTIDQVGLFGGYPRWSVDAPVPEAGPEAAAAWRSLGARTVLAAVDVAPGPVHVNLPFREPLTPTSAPVSLEPDVALPHASPTPPAHDSDEAKVLRELIDSVERGLIVAGGFPTGTGPDSVLALAEATGWPLLAEPTSGLRIPPFALAAGTLLAADQRFRAAHRPDVVVQVGASPTSRFVQSLVVSAERLVVIESPGRPADPDRAAWRTFKGDPGGLLLDALHERGPRSATEWSSAWRDADGRAAAAATVVLDGIDRPSEARAARDLAAAVPNGSLLFAGSSMPVRDLDAFMAPRAGVRLMGNRGASGIDGAVSSIFGASVEGLPAYGLIGDLSFLHDVGSLIWNAPGFHAAFVVVNNDGGGIFSFLPQARLPESLELFVTPHGTDLGAVAESAGAHHTRIARAIELGAALDQHTVRGGVSVIEIPTRRRHNVAEHRAVTDAVAGALA